MNTIDYVEFLSNNAKYDRIVYVSYFFFVILISVPTNCEFRALYYVVHSI